MNKESLGERVSFPEVKLSQNCGPCLRTPPPQGRMAQVSCWTILLEGFMKEKAKISCEEESSGVVKNASFRYITTRWKDSIRLRARGKIGCMTSLIKLMS